MNPRKIVVFLKTPTGKLLGFLALFGLGLAFAGTGLKSCRRDAGELTTRITKATGITGPVKTTEPMVPFDPKPTPGPAPTPTVAPVVAEATPTPTPGAPPQKVQIPPLSLYYNAPPAGADDEAALVSENYAPFGRLLQCKLVVTVDSSSIRTPIIGLVTEDLWHDGRLIVPAGTEIHGQAHLDRTRDRIASEGEWTLVWMSGLELPISGLALDLEKKPDGGFEITDGSAGLKGDVLRADNTAELKLFAATFLSAGSRAFIDTNGNNLLGVPVAQATAKTAALAGTSSVLDQYAAQILDSINRDGVFVRVPAGKAFYVYVTQTLDVGKATVGNVAVAKREAEAQRRANAGLPGASGSRRGEGAAGEIERLRASLLNNGGGLPRTNLDPVLSSEHSR